MCVSNGPFSIAARYMISPFFNKNYMTDPIFLDSYVKGPNFLTSLYMRIFFIRGFSRLLVLLVFNELTAIFVQLPAIKIKGQYMNWSKFRTIKYMNGSVFSKAMYMNGVGFEILARTLIP